MATTTTKFKHRLEEVVAKPHEAYNVENKSSCPGL